MGNNEFKTLLEKIKEYNGLDFKLCPDFSGIKELGKTGRMYFNIIIPDRLMRSIYERKLNSLIKSNIISGYEPNGINRISIFLTLN